MKNHYPSPINVFTYNNFMFYFNLFFRSGTDQSPGGLDDDARGLDLSILRDAFRQGQKASTHRLVRPRAVLLLSIP